MKWRVPLFLENKDSRWKWTFLLALAPLLVRGDTSIDCRVAWIDDLGGVDDAESYCIPLATASDGVVRETGDLYPIVPSLSTQFRDGDHVRISNNNDESVLRKYQLVLTPSSTVMPLPQRRTARATPRLTPIGGSRKQVYSAAVVRISLDDAQPTPTVATLEKMMDPTSDDHNFMTQYHACTHGTWSFVSNGVYDVQFRGETLADYDASPPALMIEAMARLGRTMSPEQTDPFLADFVLFCIPPGTGTWKARAPNMSWRSWYNDRMCVSLSAVIHELGHNFGLNHAFDANGLALGDTSGYMGFSSVDAHRPQRCFNGAHHWMLGFFSKWTRRFAVEKGQSPFAEALELVAFADETSDDEDRVVLINVADTIFVQYNRAIGANLETGKFADMITITRLTESGSQAVDGLYHANRQYQESNFLGTGRTLVIDFCTQVSRLKVIMGIGLDGSTCERSPMALTQPPPTTSQPTLQPSTSPTPSPTNPPTRIPTVTPTLAPTVQPTNSPTPPPSISRTSSPSFVFSFSTPAPTVQPPSPFPAPPPSASSISAPMSPPTARPVTIITLSPVENQDGSAVNQPLTLQPTFLVTQGPATLVPSQHVVAQEGSTNDGAQTETEPTAPAPDSNGDAPTQNSTASTTASVGAYVPTPCFWTVVSMILLLGVHGI